jgi:hypothetical protein
MTIDERLEKLSDRVDALTQSMELLSSLHKDLEQQTAAGFAETRARFAETLVFINRLAHVAEAHEQRLDDIEGR